MFKHAQPETMAKKGCQIQPTAAPSLKSNCELEISRLDLGSEVEFLQKVEQKFKQLITMLVPYEIHLCGFEALMGTQFAGAEAT